ncbi:MAG: hypothetical protein ACFFG0_38540, partial [Candidatus Thorarchaeota archaeon]
FINFKFKIFLKIDAIYPSDFNELKNTGNLPVSKERRKSNDKILKFLKELQFFCGGKTYTTSSDFLSFKKKLLKESVNNADKNFYYKSRYYYKV